MALLTAIRESRCLVGLAVLLPAGSVIADGGISALGALRGVVYPLIGAYLFAWLVGGTALIFVARRRRRAAGRPFFVRDRAIPAGLRGVALAQYALAIVCAQVVIVPLLDPYRLGGFDVLYFLGFAMLATASAHGYLRKSVNLGFRLGLALGLFAIAGGCYYLYREGPRDGPGWFLLGYGIALLAALHGRYRPYFGLGGPGRRARLATSASGWIGLTLGALIVAYLGGSLLVTTVFPPVEADARVVLNRVADAMAAYRDERGQWPDGLAQLDSSVDTSYRWSEVEFDPVRNELWLEVKIPLETPDLAFRLTYGLRGRTEHVGRLGKRLQ